MIIRDACPEDNDRLMAIEQHAPQGRGVQLLSERRHFFVRAERFSQTICLVAEDETRQLLGVMSAALLPVTRGGLPALGALVFDWRSNSQAATGLQRHMFRLWQALLDRIRAAAADFVFGYIRADNARSLALVQRSRGQVCDTIDCLLFPVRRPRLRADLSGVQVAATRAALAMPVQAQPSPDLSPLETGRTDDCLKLLITAGRSSVKIWDASQDQQHRVLQIPALYGLARPLLLPLSRLVALPYIPKTGDVVREWFLTDLHLADSRDWPALLEIARRLAGREQADTLGLCLSRQSPDYARLAGFSRYRLAYHLVCLPLGSGQLPSGPTFFDIRCL